MNTVNQIVASQVADHPAIGAPGRRNLTYGELLVVCQQTMATLNAYGIGRGERVAIVLPNGPDMAVAFLAVASGASAAPLNPAYRKDEFAFYLDDLGARALIVEAGSDSPAVIAANELGIPVLTITSS
ncbi:MAG: AMP-binding protein, partial [Alphaproteobacteria bacterium]